METVVLWIPCVFLLCHTLSVAGLECFCSLPECGETKRCVSAAGRCFSKTRVLDTGSDAETSLNGSGSDINTNIDGYHHITNENIPNDLRNNEHILHDSNGNTHGAPPAPIEPEHFADFESGLVRPLSEYEESNDWVHGCAESLLEAERVSCERGDVLARRADWNNGDSSLPVLMCCTAHMCNQLPANNHTIDWVERFPERGSGGTETEWGNAQGDAVLKIAVVVVPLAGAIIFVLLVIAALRMLRSDTPRKTVQSHSSPIPTHYAPMQQSNLSQVHHGSIRPNTGEEFGKDIGTREHDALLQYYPIQGNSARQSWLIHYEVDCSECRRFLTERDMEYKHGTNVPIKNNKPHAIIVTRHQATYQSSSCDDLPKDRILCNMISNYRNKGIHLERCEDNLREATSCLPTTKESDSSSIITKTNDKNLIDSKECSDAILYITNPTSPDDHTANSCVLAVEPDCNCKHICTESTLKRTEIACKFYKSKTNCSNTPPPVSSVISSCDPENSPKH